MESQHPEYYEKHNNRVKKKRQKWGSEGGKKSKPKRPEKSLVDLTNSDSID